VKSPERVRLREGKNYFRLDVEAPVRVRREKDDAEMAEDWPVIEVTPA
jgi:hypothetical protein